MWLTTKIDFMKLSSLIFFSLSLEYVLFKVFAEVVCVIGVGNECLWHPGLNVDGLLGLWCGLSVTQTDVVTVTGAAHYLGDGVVGDQHGGDALHVSSPLSHRWLEQSTVQSPAGPHPSWSLYTVSLTLWLCNSPPHNWSVQDTTQILPDYRILSHLTLLGFQLKWNKHGCAHTSRRIGWNQWGNFGLIYMMYFHLRL